MLDYSFEQERIRYMLSRGKRYVWCTPSLLLITNQSFSVHRWALAGKRHLRSKCRCPTQHNPTNTKQSFMTCPILKRPADCTRPGPSRLSFTPKPRPKQCVGRAGDPWAPLNCQDPLFRLTSLHPRQTGGSIGGVLPLCRTAAGEFYPPPGWGKIGNEYRHLQQQYRGISLMLSEVPLN